MKTTEFLFYFHKTNNLQIHLFRSLISNSMMSDTWSATFEPER